MKNNIELIIKYCDDQLEKEEKEEFEQLLQKDENLKAELKEYQKLMNEIQSEPELDESYFYKLTRSFEKPKSVFNSKISYAYAFSFMLLFFLSFFIIKNTIKENNIGFNNNEISQLKIDENLFNYTLDKNSFYEDDLYGEKILDEIYYDFLGNNEEISKYAVENSYLLVDDSIILEMDNNDFKQLYSEILLKNIR